MKSKANNGRNTQNNKAVTQFRTYSLTEPETIALMNEYKKIGIDVIPEWSSKEECYIITIGK